MTYEESYRKIGTVDGILKEVEADINHFFVSKDRAEFIMKAATKVISELKVNHGQG